MLRQTAWNVINHYKTIRPDDLKNYPQEDKKNNLSAACRSGGKDLWIQRDLIIEHFKNLKLWLLFALVFLNSTK